MPFSSSSELDVGWHAVEARDLRRVTSYDIDHRPGVIVPAIAPRSQGEKICIPHLQYDGGGRGGDGSADKSVFVSSRTKRIDVSAGNMRAVFSENAYCLDVVSDVCDGQATELRY